MVVISVSVEGYRCKKGKENLAWVKLKLMLGLRVNCVLFVFNCWRTVCSTFKFVNIYKLVVMMELSCKFERAFCCGSTTSLEILLEGC